MLFDIFYVSLVLVNKLATSSSHVYDPSSMEWAWKTYRAMNIDQGENVIFSPHSLRNALGMLLLGSTGQSEEILNTVLDTDAYWQSPDAFHAALMDTNQLLTQDGYTTTTTAMVANGIFVKDNLRMSSNFAQSLDIFYRGTTRMVPFETQPEVARRVINNFTATRTNGHLLDFLSSSVDRNTAILLVNAIYFKAAWEVPFTEKRTKPMVFRATTLELIVDFMVRPSSDTAYARRSTFEIFELPYADSAYSMYVILPFPEVQLSTLENDWLDATTIDQMLEELRSMQLTISMPKFTLTNKLSLREMLVNMGAGQLFESKDIYSTGNDFANMFDKDTPNADVSDIIHGAKLEVNEQGTVASAATSIHIGFRSMPYHIVVNRPFMFFIKHKSTGTILFWGRMENPSLQN